MSCDFLHLIVEQMTVEQVDGIQMVVESLSVRPSQLSFLKYLVQMEAHIKLDVKIIQCATFPKIYNFNGLLNQVR